jgi:hypothetical protein
VVAEAPFFDDILREIYFSKFDVLEAKIIETFKAAINYYGKKRIGNEQNYFIKLDSWHLMYYEIIRKAFPKTPFIFSYRKPSEVISSQGLQAGFQAVPTLLQPSIFGIELVDEYLTNHKIYITKVLEKYFEKLIQISQIDQNTLFVDYGGGIFTNIEYIQAFLKLDINDTFKNEMKKRGQFHSKKPSEVFSENIAHEYLPEDMNYLDKLYQKLTHGKGNT